MNRVLKAQQIGVRGEKKRKKLADLEALDKHDQAAGERLFETLTELIRKGRYLCAINDLKQI